MQTNKNPQTFHNRLIATITNSISKLTDRYFELYYQLSPFNESREELRFQYREHIKATVIRKTGWCFLLLLTLLMIIYDYASIKLFIEYLAMSAGGLIGLLISLTGGAMFILFELGIGFLLIQSKNKPHLRTLAKILAMVMICVPAYLIYTTYLIDENKTALLFHKTIALMVVSLVIHSLFFLLISEIWEAINYYFGYLIKEYKMKKNDPNKKMKEAKAELQDLYPDLDRYALIENYEAVAILAHNRAWYLKAKLQNGNTDDDYDLSDYDPEKSYAPTAHSSTISEKIKNN